MGKNTMNKAAGTWTTEIDKILIEAGLTPKRLKATGACIMPAPKHLQQQLLKHPREDKAVPLLP